MCAAALAARFWSGATHLRGRLLARTSTGPCVRGPQSAMKRPLIACYERIPAESADDGGRGCSAEGTKTVLTDGAPMAREPDGGDVVTDLGPSHLMVRHCLLN